MRRRANVPQRGEWQASPGIGWQHGPAPDAPDGLLADSREVWTVWMRAWFAAHWTPDDLPGLRVVIQLYEQTQRAFAEPFIESEGPKGGTIYVKRPNPTTELRQMLDNYGISHKGQQDRRWSPPKADAPTDEKPAEKPAPAGRYGHLRVAG